MNQLMELLMVTGGVSAFATLAETPVKIIRIVSGAVVRQGIMPKKHGFMILRTGKTPIRDVSLGDSICQSPGIRLTCRSDRENLSRTGSPRMDFLLVIRGLFLLRGDGANDVDYCEAIT